MENKKKYWIIIAYVIIFWGLVFPVARLLIDHTTDPIIQGSFFSGGVGAAFGILLLSCLGLFARDKVNGFKVAAVGFSIVQIANMLGLIGSA